MAKRQKNKKFDLKCQLCGEYSFKIRSVGFCDCIVKKEESSVLINGKYVKMTRVKTDMTYKELKGLYEKMCGKTKKKERKKKEKVKKNKKTKPLNVTSLPSKISRKKRKDFYSSAVWRSLRYKALVEYGRECQCCKDRKGPFHVDHIKPISLNWELRHDFDNLQILCEQCNLGKSNVDSTDFRDTK